MSSSAVEVKTDFLEESVEHSMSVSGDNFKKSIQFRLRWRRMIQKGRNLTRLREVKEVSLPSPRYFFDQS